MDDLAAIGRRVSVLLLIGLLGALCLAPPVRAGLGGAPQEKTEATRVAKKLKKAQANAHDAEQERHAHRHFLEEVSEYAELHAKELAKVGARGESPASQEALARAIAAKRDKAKPGDIFQPEVQSLFRRLLAEQLEGPDALDARKAVLDGNPTEEEEATVAVVVKVNAVYAAGAPRSTVPPSVLATLPALPECLRYLFVGRDLILVDSVAQLIVDFLPAAAPDLTIKRLP